MIDSIQSVSGNPFATALSKVEDKAKAGEDNSIGSFAEVMSSMAGNMVSNIRNAETMSTDGILGKASVREVADAVMTADQTLQTALAFRDKIVSAYLEIIKMPI